MKEKLIFSYINQFSLIRQLALKGINTLGYRVFNNKEVLSYIRQKHALLSNKRIIGNKEKVYIYNSFINESEYFKGASFDSAKTLSETIDSVRELIEEDEDKVFKDKLLNSINSKEKYAAVFEMYSKYIAYLKDNNLTDLIQEEREIINLNIKIDNDINIIKEEDHTPLTLKLLKTCFNNVNEIKYRELFNAPEKSVRLDNLYKTKGYIHEVGNAFKIIHTKGLALDTCTIIYTNFNNFYNSIKEFSKTFNIPVTYVDGIPATEFSAYRLLYLIIKHNDNLYGYDTLKELLYDYSFDSNKLFYELDISKDLDKFIKVIGDLKFSFNKEYNEEVYKNYSSLNKDYINQVEKFKDIMNKGYINFINEYTVINQIDDELFKNSLIKDIELYIKINNKDDFDFLRTLLNQNISSSFSKGASLTVCSFSRAKENIRDNMFFIGNDNESFHISLAENTYISDDKLIEISPKYAKTSLKLAQEKRDEYTNVIETCSQLKSNIYISYTELDEVELKKHNFISSLYILDKQSYPDQSFDEFKEKFKTINSYVGNNLTNTEEIISKYLDNSVSLEASEVLNEDEKKISDLLGAKYSPTAIEEALKCKRKFLISRILNVEDKEDYDVFRKFGFADLGDMFHDAMKFANDNKNNLKAVLDEANNIFEKTRNKRNPILKYEIEKEKENYLKLVERGFEYLKNKKQGKAEQPIEGSVDIDGDTLNIIGRADLITNEEVIDYKTKTKIAHKENSSLSCIQALIYAILSSDKPITHVEYYYPHFKKAISTHYVPADVKLVLSTITKMLKDSDFKPAYADGVEGDDLKETCKYCNFSDICGKDEWKKTNKQ